MSFTSSSAPGDSDSSSSTSSPRRIATVGLWFAIASVIVAAVLLPLFRDALYFVVLGTAAALGLLGIVVSARSRKDPGSLPGARWGLALGIAGIVVNLGLVATIAIGVAGSSAHLTQVEVRAEGGPKFTVTFADDTQSYTENWEWNGWKQFTTTQSSTEISVTADPTDPQFPISCTILWNGEVVAEETSGGGTVTCSYSE